MIESVSNKASMAQLDSNDLSPFQQQDLAAALLWDLIKLAHKYAPVTYASVGSNHCQWRVNGQAVGKPGLDDVGIVILATATQTEHRAGYGCQLPDTRPL
jgi:hypothetical protein